MLALLQIVVCSLHFFGFQVFNMYLLLFTGATLLVDFIYTDPQHILDWQACAGCLAFNSSFLTQLQAMGR